MNGLDGLSRIGEAVVLPTRDNGAPIDNYLERRDKAQAELNPTNSPFAESPAVEGLFPDDYRDIMGRYYDVSRLASDYMRKGYNISNPTTSEEFQLRTQLRELQAQIEYDEQYARQGKSLYDQARKAALSGKYDINQWNELERQYFDDRARMDFGQRLDLGLPTVSPKQNPYVFADEFNRLKSNILPEKDTNLFQQGTLYGEETTTSYTEQSRKNMAIQLISDPRGQEYLSTQFNQLPKEQQDKINKSAKDKGTSPIYEYSLSVVNENLGQVQKEANYKQRSAAWARLGIEKDNYEKLSDMLLRNTALLASGKAMEGGSYGPGTPGLYAGMKFGGGDKTIVRVDQNANQDGLLILVEYRNKNGYGVKHEYIPITNENMWTQFITPMVKENFGSDADKILNEMSKRYQQQYKGDLKNFRWQNIFPGNSSGSQPNTNSSGVQWQSSGGKSSSSSASGIKWK